MKSSNGGHRRSRWVSLIVGVSSAALVLSACSAQPSDSSSAKNFEFLAINESPSIPKILEKLADGVCSAEQAAQPLKVESVSQDTIDQKVQLLAGQDALPTMFSAGNSPKLLRELHKSGQVVDFDKALSKLGASDDLIPSAVSTINTLDGAFIGLPSELNIEGIWYNKKLFADNGIEVPTTWAELTDAAAKLAKTGVTAFSASGAEGWPITRLISGYLYRSVGANALEQVEAGKAKLTDPQYVAAAQKIADFGDAGYFGKGVASIDYDTAIAQFLSGKAAMMYMGTWALENINDKDLNSIGVENVGLMKVPAVADGAGSIDQWPTSVGIPLAMSSKKYDKNAAAWLKCIAQNYGDASLSVAGVVSGFVAHKGYGSLPDISQEIVKEIEASKDGVLWFETLFGPKATKTATTNVALLASGGMTAKEYMSLIQTDIDAER